MRTEQLAGRANPADLLVRFADIETAATRLGAAVHRTPLLRSSSLDAAVGARVLSKAEHLQRSGSFKIRGALNRMRLLTADERERGVVAFSSGNHAQGVALAARIEGVSAIIVMPADAPGVKLEATRSYGAQVVCYDRYSQDRNAVAADIAARDGRIVIPPFNDAAVIAGQGTVGLEAARECLELGIELEVALVPVGGGGLIAGLAIALKARFPDLRLVGVEPAVADDARRSLAAGRIVTIEQPRTIADGVATTAVGTCTFPIMRALVDEIVTVEEASIIRALRFVMTRMKQVVEPTGALTTAALLDGAHEYRGATVLSVFCGGNVDPAFLGSIA